MKPRNTKTIKSIEINDGYSCDKNRVIDSHYFFNTNKKVSSVPINYDRAAREKALDAVANADFVKKDFERDFIPDVCKPINTKIDLYQDFLKDVL